MCIHDIYITQVVLTDRITSLEQQPALLFLDRSGSRASAVLSQMSNYIHAQAFMANDATPQAYQEAVVNHSSTKTNQPAMTIKIARVAVILSRKSRTLIATQNQSRSQLLTLQRQKRKHDARTWFCQVRRKNETAKDSIVGNMFLRHLLTSDHPLTIISKLKRNDITK